MSRNNGFVDRGINNPNIGRFQECQCTAADRVILHELDNLVIIRLIVGEPENHVIRKKAINRQKLPMIILCGSREEQAVPPRQICDDFILATEKFAEIEWIGFIRVPVKPDLPLSAGKGVKPFLLDTRIVNHESVMIANPLDQNIAVEPGIGL